VLLNLPDIWYNWACDPSALKSRCAPVLLSSRKPACLNASNARAASGDGALMAGTISRLTEQVWKSLRLHNLVNGLAVVILRVIQKRNAEHQDTFSVSTIGYVVGIPADLPSIAITDWNPWKVAVGLYSTAALLLKNITPPSDHTYVIADRNYAIDICEHVFGMVVLEIVSCINFFDGLPTVTRVEHLHQAFQRLIDWSIGEVDKDVSEVISGPNGFCSNHRIKASPDFGWIET
jgi:hypothetical protein